MFAPSSLYHRHRFPPEIISYAVYLYYRFTVSYRDVEEMLARRGIVVSYETIRRWCLKFGPHFAVEIRRRRPQPKPTWHLDEMYIKINGRTWYLWRAVDADGMVLDIVLQERRNQAAAEVLLRRLMERLRRHLRIGNKCRAVAYYRGAHTDQTKEGLACEREMPVSHLLSPFSTPQTSSA